MSGTRENQAAGAKAPAASAKSATGIVAPGRSVMVGRHRHGPGSEVTLPEDEILQLRVLGFLLDPDKPVLTAGHGPEYRSRSDIIRAG